MLGCVDAVYESSQPLTSGLLLPEVFMGRDGGGGGRLNRGNIGNIPKSSTAKAQGSGDHQFKRKMCKSISQLLGRLEGFARTAAKTLTIKMMK